MRPDRANARSARKSTECNFNGSTSNQQLLFDAYTLIDRKNKTVARMTSFNSLCQDLMDQWLTRDKILKVDELVDIVADRLTVKMALNLIETDHADPYEWKFTRVRDFGFKSSLLDRVRKELPNTKLRGLNRTYMDETVIPPFLRAVESGR